jgi:hypothetical protein
MSSTHPTITVAGDVCLDWLQFPINAKDSGLNWELYPGLDRMRFPGGALLLAEFLRRSTDPACISSPDLKEVEKFSSQQVLQSIADIDLFPYSSDPKEKNKPVYRVRRFLGYTGSTNTTSELSQLKYDDPDSDIVILDDAGNGFRKNSAYWPKAIKTDEKKPIVILKMSRPLTEGKLWDHLCRFHSEKLIIVINADDLRAMGVNISRCLSWERTGLDFVWQMASNPKLLLLANCANLVVRFGLEGAIHYTRKENRIESRLYFDPTTIEDGFKIKYPGEMQGLSCAFVAALAVKIVDSLTNKKELCDAVSEGVQNALADSRRLYKYGFGNTLYQPSLPNPEFFSMEKESDNVAYVIVPNATVSESADPNFWCILKEAKGTLLEEIAFDIVLRGDNAALTHVPVGSFGKLKTVDRAEVESYRSISNLMQEYIRSESSSRPLSIAVFGSPGSGKSFAVTEVAESVAPGQVVRVDFNVSQFKSTSDLISVFNRVRDIALTGKIPLVFFDEFDSTFEGKLGWLKYFLAPMQDGVFREGETTHPIGKSIFVFAGGIYSSFGAFTSYKPDVNEGDLEDFKDAKGPDFVSRLRGYVNILGPNPIDDSDTVFMIRRAMLLRSLLERKAKQLFDSNKQVRIDSGVLRALIKVPNYKHGARSIEAIIEMSMLNGQRCWEQAFLPAKEQLKLHVDEEMFSRLVMRDVLLGSAREVIAKAIHEKYRVDQKGNKHASDLSMQPWDMLSENLKESNRRQADNIPEKLRSIGYGFGPKTGKESEIIKFEKEEIEIMAELEHERWVSERLLDGWVYSKERNPDKKMSPYLVPWKDLPEDEDKNKDPKEWDRNAVQRLPEMLDKLGFEIYKLR